MSTSIRAFLDPVDEIFMMFQLHSNKYYDDTLQIYKETGKPVVWTHFIEKESPQQRQQQQPANEKKEKQGKQPQQASAEERRGAEVFALDREQLARFGVERLVDHIFASAGSAEELIVSQRHFTVCFVAAQDPFGMFIMTMPHNMCDCMAAEERMHLRALAAIDCRNGTVARSGVCGGCG